MNIKILDLLYPRRCALCDGLLGRKEKYLCKNCAKDLAFYDKGRCVLCGRASFGTENLICSECAHTPHAFDQAAAPFVYEGKVRASILRMKYSGRPEYARYYAHAVFTYSEKLIKSFAPSVITHVPAHVSRLRERGYDQAGLIAKELAKLSGIPFSKKLIVREKKTRPLAPLSPEERRLAVKGVFRALEDLNGQKVILVDDIFTTGSTVNEASRALKIQGAKEVLVLTAATSKL